MFDTSKITMDDVSELTLLIADLLGIEDDERFEQIHEALEKFFDYPDHSSYN